MIKELKKRRLPKEVLFLIDVLNNTDNLKNDGIGIGRRSIEYKGYILFDFGVVENKIIPYYHFINKLFGDIELFISREEYAERGSILKYYTKIALENSIYSDYKIYEWS